MAYEPVLTSHINEPNTFTLDFYVRNQRGYEGLRKALTQKPNDIIEQVKASGLRGRGGAGFPTGLKWQFVLKDTPKPKYICCNADESEPGTFKDHVLMERNPHLLIEGCAIGCHAIGAKVAYIYIRGEFYHVQEILEAEIEKAYTAGYLGKNIFGSGFDCDVYVHRGAGAYEAGEETALIESLEGKRAQPRLKPPFPAVEGLYQCPTAVNNVETLCNVVHILKMGGGEYAKIGRPNNTGTRIVCVSGHVNKPGYYEIENGVWTLGQIINDLCGGVRGGKKIKAIIPGGSSAKVLKMGEKIKLKQKQPDGSMAENELGILDIPYDFDSLMAAGTMSGSGAIIVMDETTDIVKALNNLNAFYAHESCGQCTPCREGSLWLRKITDRVVGGGGRASDVGLLVNVADNIAGRTICAFGEACAWPVQSFVAKFREDFEAACARGDGKS